MLTVKKQVFIVESRKHFACDSCIQMMRFRLSDLIYDAAGEEGGRLLAVGVKVERHQSIRPHREVVVHGQNLRRSFMKFVRIYPKPHHIKPR